MVIHVRSESFIQKIKQILKPYQLDPITPQNEVTNQYLYRSLIGFFIENQEKGEKPLSRKEFDAYNREWFSINYPDTYWHGTEKVYGSRVPVWYHIPDDHADEQWYDENGNIVEIDEEPTPIETINRWYEDKVRKGEIFDQDVLR